MLVCSRVLRGELLVASGSPYLGVKGHRLMTRENCAAVHTSREHETVVENP